MAEDTDCDGIPNVDDSDDDGIEESVDCDDTNPYSTSPLKTKTAMGV